METFAFQLFGSRPLIEITPSVSETQITTGGSRVSAMSLTQPSAQAEQTTVDKLVDEITQLKEKEKEAYGQKLGILVSIVGLGIIFLLIQK